MLSMGEGLDPALNGIPQTLVDYRLSTEPKGVLAQRCSLNMTARIITVTGQVSPADYTSPSNILFPLLLKIGSVP